MRRKPKRIKDKKAVQLKLSSMSEHWQHTGPKKSGKHHSQEMQKLHRRHRRRIKRAKKTQNK